MSAKPMTVLGPAQTIGQVWTPSLSPYSNTIASMLLIDLLTLSAVFALSVLVRHAITPTYHLVSYWEFFICIAALLVAFGFQGLYPAVLLHPADEMRRIFLAVTIVFLIMACSSFLWRNVQAYSRSVFLVTWALGSPCVMFNRRLSRRFLSRCRWWGLPAVILGFDSSARRVLSTLGDGHRGIKIVGILSDDDVATTNEQNVPFLGRLTAAHALARSKWASIAIVTIPFNARVDARDAIQDYCRGFSHVILVPNIPGLCSLGVSAREIGGELGLEMPQRLFHASSAFAKRFLDLALSSIALLTLAPLFLLLALAVRLSSRGSIFFGQERYGRNGSSFKALKFRTMVPNAEQALAKFLSAHPGLLEEWNRDHKLKNDPRITSVGKWMRRLSLDELPQIWNVFRGDMSLIGPRPIVHAEVEKYGRAFDLYSRVRPGMTGLWQVSGRNRTTYQQRVALDQFYVNNWSVWPQLWIRK
jgi:Undecaprenyl-phosphate galactose phosphotransferase WbaP